MVDRSNKKVEPETSYLEISGGRINFTTLLVVLSFFGAGYLNSSPDDSSGKADSDESCQQLKTEIVVIKKEIVVIKKEMNMMLARD